MNALQVNLGENDTGKSGWLDIVRRQVDSLRYGVVQIVVHDSQVTQIEKTERLRLDKPGARGI
ncbi:MAG: YezD family protein [Verrucomicrobiota bacterium]|jgi:hypothetical protein